MTDGIHDFQQLMDRWPTKAAFGRDIGLDDPHAARIFHRRNRVPRAHWAALIKSAHQMGMDFVDQDFLDRLYDAGRKQGR